MNALTFTPKSNSAHNIDCRRLTQNNLTNLTVSQIKDLSLLNNKNSPKIGDYFDVSGTDTNHVVFKNTLHQLHYIGHKMTHGQITIEGDCGDFLGASMRTGNIICHGNANDRVGDQ